MNKLNVAALSSVCAIALAGCATLEESAAELVGQTYDAELTGAKIVGTGDADASATFELTVAGSVDQICYDLNDERNLGTVTAVMLHRGGPTQNGPMVANFERNDQNGYQNCTGLTEWLEDFVQADPTGYYIQVHTTEYPNGAIRGQLDAD